MMNMNVIIYTCSRADLTAILSFTVCRIAKAAYTYPAMFFFFFVEIAVMQIFNSTMFLNPRSLENTNRK